MGDAKSSISQAESYEQIGEFWDSHDVGDFWEQTEPVEFTVDLQSESIYYAVEPNLSERLRTLATARGVSTETLINLWLQEKVVQAAA